MWQCKSCNHSNIDSKLFCTSCGQPIGATPVIPFQRYCFSKEALAIKSLGSISAFVSWFGAIVAFVFAIILITDSDAQAIGYLLLILSGSFVFGGFVSKSVFDGFAVIVESSNKNLLQ